ncbi:MerR HTH family regulatory protein [Gottschalkia purinilytica]|uniref:MerR HTH family regulatory protein n=1 Tax=Gottschalkia purinilytica TaxID=1503 RepID=A0A0L0WEE8_GOTPU|nr:helix-turn-helix domain-containing protein [Gottschalkia purinilytica]KNF09853.1 MerR HTH family regulatory protein [Gottschalkia purinilytica]
MDKLLTQKDLAERWQVTVRAIENWRKEGVLTPCKGIPAIRFTQQHIAELEGVKLEKASPLRVRRLENEIEKLKEENEKLKGILTNVMVETSKVITS